MAIVEGTDVQGLPFGSDTYRIGSLLVPNSVTRENPYQWVLRVQPFDSGGFEVYASRVDLGKLHRYADELAPARGVRTAPAVVNQESRLRSSGRARRQVRLHARNMGADRMLTLTTRQSENTCDELWERFGKMSRAYSHETGEDFNYVAVVERHPTNRNHWHMHLAVPGFIRIGVMNRHWWNACGGRGMGNVDIKKMKGNPCPSRLARYIAKYIGKDLDDDDGSRFNRKRYSCSRKALPESMRFVLADVANDAVSAFERTRTVMGLSNDAAMSSIARNDGVWFRPDGLGFWMDWRPEWGSLDPAPF